MNYLRQDIQHNNSALSLTEHFGENRTTTADCKQHQQRNTYIKNQWSNSIDHATDNSKQVCTYIGDQPEGPTYRLVEHTGKNRATSSNC